MSKLGPRAYRLTVTCEESNAASDGAPTLKGHILTLSTIRQMAHDGALLDGTRFIDHHGHKLMLVGGMINPITEEISHG